jgi:hypothetical protein
VDQNICAFIDAYSARDNAILYLEAYDLGGLRDVKENGDATNQELSEINVSDNGQSSLWTLLEAGLTLSRGHFCRTMGRSCPWCSHWI